MEKMGQERGQRNVNERYLLLVFDERQGRQRPTCADENYLPVVFLTYLTNHKGEQESFEEQTPPEFRCLSSLCALHSQYVYSKTHRGFVVYRAVLACNANAVMGASDAKATPSVLRFLSINIAYGCMDFTF